MSKKSARGKSRRGKSARAGRTFPAGREEALFFRGLGAISKSSCAHAGMHGAATALPCGPSPLAFSITINYDRILIKIPFSKNEYGASAAKVLLDFTARQSSGATAAARE